MKCIIALYSFKSLCQNYVYKMIYSAVKKHLPASWFLILLHICHTCFRSHESSDNLRCEKRNPPSLLNRELAVINHILWKADFNFTSYTQPWQDSFWQIECAKRSQKETHHATIERKMRNRVTDISLKRVTKAFLRLWGSTEPEWEHGRAHWWLVQEVTKEPRQHVKTCRPLLPQLRSLINDSKIRKRLSKNGIHRRPPSWKPLTTKKNKDISARKHPDDLQNF